MFGGSLYARNPPVPKEVGDGFHTTLGRFAYAFSQAEGTNKGGSFWTHRGAPASIDFHHWLLSFQRIPNH